MKQRNDSKSVGLSTFVKGQLFDAIVPTYLLDESYHFLDWNKSFEFLIATPLKLQRETHITNFVDQLANKKDSLERAAKVFAVGNTPLVDHETFFLNHASYGRLELEKFATSIYDNELDQVGWIVHLNISAAEKKTELFDDLMQLMGDVAHNEKKLRPNL